MSSINKKNNIFSILTSRYPMFHIVLLFTFYHNTFFYLQINKKQFKLDLIYIVGYNHFVVFVNVVSVLVVFVCYVIVNPVVVPTICIFAPDVVVAVSALLVVLTVLLLLFLFLMISLFLLLFFMFFQMFVFLAVLNICCW